MDTTVTVMDVVAIGGVIVSSAFFIFGYGGSIDINSQEIEHVQSDIARIERKSEQHEIKMVRLIEKNTEAQEKGRLEARQNHIRVSDKLDKIIDRELSEK